MVFVEKLDTTRIKPSLTGLLRRSKDSINVVEVSLSCTFASSWVKDRRQKAEGRREKAEHTRHNLVG